MFTRLEPTETQCSCHHVHDDSRRNSFQFYRHNSIEWRTIALLHEPHSTQATKQNTRDSENWKMMFFIRLSFVVFVIELYFFFFFFLIHSAAVDISLTNARKKNSKWIHNNRRGKKWRWTLCRQFFIKLVQCLVACILNDRMQLHIFIIFFLLFFFSFSGRFFSFYDFVTIALPLQRWHSKRWQKKEKNVYARIKCEVHRNKRTE